MKRRYIQGSKNKGCKMGRNKAKERQEGVEEYERGTTQLDKPSYTEKGRKAKNVF